ncbi:MAG: hypothetical protein IRZ00_10540 [Gemmatimonadetes bacterium]|nr:hypothetical protein [Gemmatimonadota bacterium]
MILSYADPNRAKRLLANLVMAMYHGGPATETAPAPHREPAAGADRLRPAGPVPAAPPRDAVLIAPAAPDAARLRFVGG